MSNRFPRRPRVRRFSQTRDPELVDAYRRLHVPATAAGIERRHFLQGLLAVGGLTALGVPMLSGRAEAGAPLAPDERILVVLLMGGGNDSLNMVCPLEQGAYQSIRGSFGIAAAGTHSVGDGLYLHPNLGRLKTRFDQGKVAIVNGVGDALDDHSHFVNMARWMAGRSNEGIWTSGWLGRYLDGIGGDGLSGVSIGHEGVPLHMQRPSGETTALPPSGSLFGTDYSENNQNRAMYDALKSIDPNNVGLSPWAAEFSRSVAACIDTADTVGPVFSPEITEEDDLVVDATLAARLINLDVGARVIALSMGGYDHHDDQRPAHDEFMTSVDRAIDTLFDQVNPSLRGRVMLMSFSEFARRVEPNGSDGTDHGTAGALFVVGDSVNGGLYGAQPSLSNLDNRGDLKHEVDFRSVYSTVLEDWLQADPVEIIGGNYENLGFLSYTCQGEEATHVGTSGADTIDGTPGRDVIVALGGADLIYGRGGDDLICAGAGNDTAFGGSGDDEIHGDAGSDDLRGEDGADSLHGGADGDQLHGGRGPDTLAGDGGADQLFGRRSQDTFVTDVMDVVLRGK